MCIAALGESKSLGRGNGNEQRCKESIYHVYTFPWSRLLVVRQDSLAVYYDKQQAT